MIQDGGGETKYRMRGQIADNFESNEDFHEPDTRIGVTDTIDTEELTKNVTLDAGSEDNDTEGRIFEESDSGEGSTGTSPDNAGGYSSGDKQYSYGDLGDALAGENSDSSADDSASTNGTDSTNETDQKDNGGSDYQPTDDEGDCVGWGCNDSR
jgi:hypothetical protein